MRDAVKSFLTDRIEIERRIAARAQEDPEFADALRADARAAVASLLGCELPTALEVRVVDRAATEIAACVPAPASEALDDAELESVAGGGMMEDMMAQNMQLLALQNSVQQESRMYQTISNALIASSRAASNSIRNMK